MTYFPRLFSVDNQKAAKASGFGYLNAIHYMAPYTLGGFGSVCSHSTAACEANCLGGFPLRYGGGFRQGDK